MMAMMVSEKVPSGVGGSLLEIGQPINLQGMPSNAKNTSRERAHAFMRCW